MKLTIYLTALLFAQTPTNAENPIPSNEPEIDENKVVVYGIRPLNFYRQKVIQAEEALFDLYNQLTEHDEFKVYCERKQHNFSRLKTRKCQSKFVDNVTYKYQQDAISKATRRQLENGIINPVNRGKKEAELRKKRKAQIEDLAQLLKENKQLLSLFHELEQAKKDFKDASEAN